MSVYIGARLISFCEFKIGFLLFLGAFVKLRKATVNFVMSVRPSSLNNSVPTARIFMEFHI